MHDFKRGRSTDLDGELQTPAGPRPGVDVGEAFDPGPLPELGEPIPPARRGRRRRWTAGEPMSPIERKRLAAVQLRKAYARIKSDFSEAYEYCRNDTQRRALEIAHRSACEVHRRALQDRLLDDRGGWASALDALREDRERAKRHLARLVNGDAVMRILRRLAEIEQTLAVLAV